MAIFEKGPMEELATIEQKYEWKQNLESGLIHREAEELVKGVSGHKRTSDQRENQSIEYWFNPDPNKKVSKPSPKSTVPAKRVKGKEKAKGKEGDRPEQEDKETFKTSIKSGNERKLPRRCRNG